jgi:predicted SnoaL-like aldol condensation-catalyzing enzyme
MDTNHTMSQVEMNKAIIQRYFDAYNNKNEAIFDEVISPDYIDHGQTAYMGSSGKGIDGAKNLDLVGTYWKGTLIPKAISNDQQAEKTINYRGMSIYRIQNNKMAETWHVIDGLPPKMLKGEVDEYQDQRN